MNRWIMLCAVGFLLPATVIAQQVVRQQPVTLQLDVNALGKVTAAKVMPPARQLIVIGGRKAGTVRSYYGPVPDILAKAATKVAMKWRFQPPKINGRSVAGRTWAHATLQIIKRGDGTYDVDVRYESNGPYIREWAGPELSGRAIRLHHAVAVVTEAEVQPDGSVSDVHILKVFRDPADHQVQIARAIRSAMRQWKGIPMKVAGRAVATRMRIPFIYAWKDTPRAELDRLKQQVEVMLHYGPGHGHMSEPVRSGEALAMDSPFVKQPSG